MKSGSIVVTPKVVLPPPPVTGHRVKKCMLAASQDCGGGISGDHVVSASVLRQINVDKIHVHGNGISRLASPDSDSLKVKRLCKRHNSSLSNLDNEAGRFFRGVQRFNEALLTGGSVPTRLLIFHTFDLERWLLKTMFAAYFAKLSNVTADRFAVPDYAAALFNSQIGPPYGLFVPTKTSSHSPREMTVGRHVNLSLVTDGSLLCGIHLALGGLELRFLMAGNPASLRAEHESCAYRPKFVNLFLGSTVMTLGMASDHTTNLAVWMSPQKDSPLPVDPPRQASSSAPPAVDSSGAAGQGNEASA